MAGNSGAWGVALYNTRSGEWVSLSGGDEVDPFLPSDPVGCLLVPPDGMGVPEMRVEDVTFTHRDGTRMYSDWYENRVVTLTVLVCNDGCPGCPTGRAKARAITDAWSRRCGETELRIFTDCHDPSFAEPEVTGPYSIMGRPRQALVSWRRSNVGCADVTLRFDALDHRLVIPGTDGEFEQCSPDLVAQESRTNLARDPNMRDSDRWAEVQDSTGDVSVFTEGGPQDQGFIRYELTTGNTTSPMYILGGGSGISGIPVSVGTTYTVSSYWQSSEDVTGAGQRYDVSWYDVDGDLISDSVGSDVNPGMSAGVWWRGGESFVAPDGAVFMQPRVVWDGLYGDGVVLDSAGLLVEEGDAVLPFFSGDFLGTWLGDPDGSASISPFTRRNQVANPRPVAPAGDTWSTGTASTVTWTVDGSGGPDTSDPTIAFPGTAEAGFHRLAWPEGGAFSFFRPDLLLEQFSPQPVGTPYRVAAWVRVNQVLPGLELRAVQYDTAGDHPGAFTSLDGLVPDEWTLVEVTGVTLTEGIGFVVPYFSADPAPLVIPEAFQMHVALVISEFDPVAPFIYFDGSSDGATWGADTNASISGLSFVESTSVEVGGDLCASISIELVGPLGAPIVVQETRIDDPDFGVVNSQYVQYNVDIDDGEVVTIDTGSRTVVSSTDGVVPGRVTGNLSWQLDPGSHELSLSAGSGIGSARVCWSASVVSG